jgi:hypothetical protein
MNLKVKKYKFPKADTRRIEALGYSISCGGDLPRTSL